MSIRFYDSREWRDLSARALARDGYRCSVARLLGGRCSGTLHAHHLVPVTEAPELALDLDNCISVCASHHPTVEAIRRQVVHGREREVPPCRCRGGHRYESGREECRRRREMVAA